MLVISLPLDKLLDKNYLKREGLVPAHRSGAIKVGRARLAAGVEGAGPFTSTVREEVGDGAQLAFS